MRMPPSFVHRSLPVLFCLIMAGCNAPSSGTFPRYGQRQANFAPGGELNIRIPVGSLQIRTGTGPGLRLRWHIHRGHAWFWQRAGRLSSARLDFQVRGRYAEVIFDYPRGGQHGSIDATLRVPRQTSLRAQLGVGKITVGRLSGNEYLHTGVGAIQIHLLHPLRYRVVHLHTGVGSISGSPWPVQQHVVEQQVITTSNSGAFRLDANTGVGGIQLQP